MHWADFRARKLSERETPQVIVSGITPSGEFHIGHLREILTAEMIHRACLDAGLDSRYVFIVDSMDPLRRVYDFLSDEYEQYIGVPLAFIPAPNQDGTPSNGDTSYAEFFLGPFLEALTEIGVFPEIVMNHETYENGEFAEKIDLAIRKRKEIREVIMNVSGRDLPEDWFPYSPRGMDGSMDGVTVTSYEHPYVFWDDENGVSGKSDIRRADGKMPWRLDWAARWIIHGVTCEPAGKDHGAAGGSYDTGIPICELLGGSPPDKIVYEWIQLKGMGPMSSSSGITIGPMEALSLVPPEILRYVIARSKIGRHIEFNTGGALFEIADEYERLLTKPDSGEITKRMETRRETREGALKMSQVIRGSDPMESFAGVSFRHLAMLAQIKSSDEEVWRSLRKSNHITGNPGESIVNRLSKMRNWVESEHFPEDARINIQTEISEEVRRKITDGQASFLKLLSDNLGNCEWLENSITDVIRSSINTSEINGKEAFSGIYLALLGSDHGPRASSLIAEMEREDVLAVLSIV
tara:strand:+ start:18173 stop:19741 length:1569 start_codon:yes stop_codon:yes gene_type:complete